MTFATSYTIRNNKISKHKKPINTCITNKNIQNKLHKPTKSNKKYL